MNNLYIDLLRALRYFNLYYIRKKIILHKPKCITDADVASALIASLLNSDEPTMIARFGSTELAVLINYLGIIEGNKSPIKYVLGKSNAWWWNLNLINRLNFNSGFFHSDFESVTKFCKLMINDISQVNLLGSWLPDERQFDKCLSSVPKVDLELLNPYFSKVPWTKSLKGKRVLVIHPYAETIASQYLNRKNLFKEDLLPEFELLTIKAVQTVAGEQSRFKNWFDALDSMKNQMNEIEFDICLIGCGAYGFLLAAHAKRIGKKGFHLGGSLQLLFGIRGKRWEDPNYNPSYNFSALMNDYWVRPKSEERPTKASDVEDACYW